MESEGPSTQSSVNINHPGVVVLGDHTVVHHHPPTPDRLHPDQNRLVTDAPLPNPDEDELLVVNKVSTFIRNDSLNKHGKINRNPLTIEQTPIQEVFINPVFKCVDNNQQQQVQELNERELMYSVFEACPNCNSPSRVLVYGHAGVGKTTLCQKYVYDWANPRFESIQPFSQFKIVIFLKLRAVRGTLEEILESEVFCKRLTDDEKVKFFSYMKKHPREFLFLLDGVSECNLDEVPDVNNFLLDKEYRGVYLIATIRPELKHDWLEMSKTFHSRYCITGHSKERVLEFLSTLSAHLQEGETKDGALIQIECIKKNSDLIKLAQIPLITLVTCELWKEHDKLPTITKLLGRYTDVVLKLYKLRSGKEIESQQILSSHEELALLALLQGRKDDKEETMFTSDDLNACKVDDFGCKSGLLGAELKEDRYKFAHKRIEEYFAARWFVNNWNSEKAEESEKSEARKSEKAENSKKAGFKSEKGAESERAGKSKKAAESENAETSEKEEKSEKVEKFLQSLLRDSEVHFSILVFIAGLLSEKNDGKTLLQFLERLATTSSETAANFFQESCYDRTMDLILACVAEAWRDGNSAVDRGILSLLEGFKPFKNSKTPDRLPLTMSHAAAQGLAHVVPKLGLKRLILSGIVISNPEAKFIATKCLQKNNKLESVKFSHSLLCPEGVKAVCDAFSSMINLVEVDLSCCRFGDEGLKAIAALIQHVNAAGVTSFQLGSLLNENHLQKEQPVSSRQIPRVDSIGKFCEFKDECERCPPSEEAIKTLISVIDDQNLELVDFSLPACCVGNLINEWLEVFGRNKKLKRIRLHLKELNQTLQENLVKLVNNMEQLERMSLELEVKESKTSDYSTHLTLKEKSRGKIELSVSDHTHSTKDPLRI